MRRPCRGCVLCATMGALLTGAAGASAQLGPRQRPPRPPPHGAEAARRTTTRTTLPCSARSRRSRRPPTRSRSRPRCRSRSGRDWDSRPPSPEGCRDHELVSVLRAPRRRRAPPAAAAVSHRAARAASATRRSSSTASRRRRTPRVSTGSSTTGAARCKLDMDVVFPAFWRVRDGDTHVVVAGPLVHREAPGENDNWLAPLYFAGGAQGRRVLPLAAPSDDVALERAGRVHARGPVLPRPHGAERRRRRRAVLLPRRQREHRRQPAHVHAHPAAALLSLRARDRLEHHDGRRAGHRAVEREAQRLRRRAALLQHPGQARERRRARVAHDALSALSLRLRPGELALHRARLLPARIAHVRHAAVAVLLAGRRRATGRRR